MKKLTLFLIVFFTINFLNLNAQGLFYETGLYENDNIWSDYQYYIQGNSYMHSKYYKSLLEKNKIVGYEHKVSKFKKDKPILKSTSVVKFDDNYNLLDKNDGKKHYIYTYNEDNMYTDYKYIKKGEKLKKHEVIEYNDSSKITKYNYTKHNDKKLKRKWVAEYDKNQKRMLTKVFFDKDGSTENHRWDYEYYEDGKQKQTKYYKKNELKHIWNYTCDDEGKEQKNDVKTTKVCKIKEYLDDSSYVIVNRTTDNKGRIRKNTSKYNKFKNLLEFRSYNNKDKIVYRYEYIYDCKQRKIAEISYKRSGIIFYKKEWYYNNDDLIVKTKFFKRKGKLRRSSEFKFNNNKQLVEETSFNKRYRQNRKYKFEYNDRGNIIKTTSYDIKNNPKWLYETKFTYKQ